MKTTQACFITGMARSGTTLLEKLLCNHGEVGMLAQPFPFLFTEAKARFLRDRDLQFGRYPLSHYFQEERYSANDLADFLTGNCIFTRDEIRNILESMKDYSGQLTDYGNLDELIGSEDFDEFASIYTHLTNRLTGAKPVVGAKEIYDEEFLPYLLGRGVKCIIIIRDPRDVIASLNYGEGPKYGGMIKPTLFHIRNWRRSVAFMMELSTNENFLAMRYEDLARMPMDILKHVTEWFGIEPFSEDCFAEGIRDQSGNLWKGNSSHDERTFISTESIGAFREKLPIQAIQYIEACCGPEMRKLGYGLDIETNNYEQVMREFREPVAVERDEFPADYSWSDKEIVPELKRLSLVKKASPLAEKVARKYFVFPRVYASLTQ